MPASAKLDPKFQPSKWSPKWLPFIHPSNKSSTKLEDTGSSPDHKPQKIRMGLFPAAQKLTMDCKNAVRWQSERVTVEVQPTDLQLKNFKECNQNPRKRTNWSAEPADEGETEGDENLRIHRDSSARREACARERDFRANPRSRSLIQRFGGEEREWRLKREWRDLEGVLCKVWLVLLREGKVLIANGAGEGNGSSFELFLSFGGSKVRFFDVRLRLYSAASYGFRSGSEFGPSTSNVE